MRCTILCVVAICRLSTSNTQFAVLDFAKFLDNNEREGFVNDLREALVGPGFYYVKNHNVDLAVVKKSFENSYKFMHLPLEDKQKYAKEGVRGGDLYHGWSVGEVFYGERSTSESMMFNASNLDTIKSHPEFSGSGLYEFTVQMKDFLQSMLRAYALALGIEENFFYDLHSWQEGGESLDCTRINYYPKMSGHLDQGENEGRLGAHTDFLTIAALYQDGKGLEVWNKQTSAWVSIPPIDGTLVVNTGNLMQFWSNVLFTSNLHRVRTDSQTRKHERISLVFFTGPRGDVIIDPRDIRKDVDAKFRPVKAHDWVYDRMMSMYDSEIDSVDVEDQVGPQKALKDLSPENLEYQTVDGVVADIKTNTKAGGASMLKHDL